MMAERLKSILDSERIGYSTILHAPAYGAQYTASLMHVCGKEVAKTVVLRCGKDTVLAILPASYRINFEKFGALVHGSVELMEEEECKRLFPDCEPGVFPAFGELYGLRVYIDSALAEDHEIVVGDGKKNEAILMNTADFLSLVKPRVASFSELVRVPVCSLTSEEEEEPVHAP